MSHLTPQMSASIFSKKLGYLFRRSTEKLSHVFEDIERSLRYQISSSPPVNKREIRVIGLRRSGNHAVINWIGKQAKGNSVFINHVRPIENPYRNQYESQLRSGKPNTENKNDWKCRDIDWWRAEKEGEFSYKDSLIYSYEDQELEKIAHPLFERKRELYLGKSETRFDVIVMRDPFNLFASRLKTKPREDGPNFSMLEVYSRRYSLAELWITYAQECLGETSYLKGQKIFVNYNRWFLDVNYRQEIAEQLGIDFSDEGIDDISDAGRGSSFDGDKYSGSAHKMDVLNRWKSFKGDPLYRKLINHDGVRYYSQLLFGEISGTDIFLSD